jgi:hypothetical protein
MSQQPVWFMIVLALDAVIAVTGIWIGASFNMTGLLAVGPLLACARCNGRMTAVVAGCAVALCVPVAAVTGTIGTVIEGYRIGMVAVAGGLAVLAAFLAVFRELAFGEPDLIELAEKMDARLWPRPWRCPTWPRPTWMTRSSAWSGSCSSTRAANSRTTSCLFSASPRRRCDPSRQGHPGLSVKVTDSAS